MGCQRPRAEHALERSRLHGRHAKFGQDTTKEDMSKSNVVGMLGGLGNQLFQYAFGIWLELRTGHNTRFDLSAYRRRNTYLSIRDFGFANIEGSNWLYLIPFPEGKYHKSAILVRCAVGPRNVRQESRLRRLPTTPELQANAWYYGYWQFPAMVKEVLPELRARIGPFEQQSLAPRNRIGMHIRRGDMVGTGAELGPEYYLTALARLRAEHGISPYERVSVFSDDIAWCRRELRLASVDYIQGGSAASDLYSLSRHELLILSGSTFSWWSATLNERDPLTVCAPAPLIPGARVPLNAAGWIRIPRDGRHV